MKRAPFAGLRTVILANGDFPSGGPELEALLSAETTVCCDGAADALVAYGRVPDLAVGDGDSSSPAVRAKLGKAFLRIREQETDDLAKAFAAAYARGARGMTIVGAGGGREDHLLANVFRLPDFAALDPEVSMITDRGRFDVVDGTRRFEAVKGTAVSVFAPFPRTRAASRGLVWPLEGADLSMLYAGTLNRVSGARGFSVKSSRPVIVYRAFAK